MNTRIQYMYRDAGNNKVSGDEVISGELSEDDVRIIKGALANFPENGFIPDKVGLPSLLGTFSAGGGVASDLDHCWHEWEGVSSTGGSPTVQVKASDLVTAFERVANKGWDEFDRRSKG